MEQLQRADVERNNNNKSDDSANTARMCRVVMADFAHVFPANGSRDTNYAFGLDKLIEHLHLLLDADYKFKDVRPPSHIESNNADVNTDSQ